jgi:hypothetical protein
MPLLDCHKRMIILIHSEVAVEQSSSVGNGVRRGASFAPGPLPGRGFAQTRMSLDEIQIAASIYGLSDADRLESLQAVSTTWATSDLKHL